AQESRGRTVESVKIILLCVAAAVLYGVCQDQITARVCVEYFTVGHPPVFGGITDPTLLALSWGVIATWWVGLMLGVPAAVLSRVGSRPKLDWRDLRRPICVLFVVIAITAVVAGGFGYLTANLVEPGYPGDLRPSRRFQADAAA